VKARDFDKVVRKFGMRTRYGRDLWAWFEHNGKIITRTRRSKGNGDLPERLISNQLALTRDELRQAVRCTLKLDDYIKLLKKKGEIEEEKSAED